jgi:hypothetical protein
MSAAGKGGFPQPPSIVGGPAPAQPIQQPVLPRVDTAPVTGYQQPTEQTPGQPGVQIGMPGGKSGFPGGPQLGGGPVPFDPNQPNPLGPEGQQPITPQPPMGSPVSPGGKGGFAGPGAVSEVLTPQQTQAFANSIFNTK